MASLSEAGVMLSCEATMASIPYSQSQVHVVLINQKLHTYPPTTLRRRLCRNMCHPDQDERGHTVNAL